MVVNDPHIGHGSFNKKMTPLDFFDQKELKDRGKTAVTHSRRRLKSYTRQNWVGCSKFIGAKGFEFDSDRKSCSSEQDLGDQSGFNKSCSR